jgi:hypothetical protein
MFSMLTVVAVVATAGAAQPGSQSAAPECITRYDAAAERADRLAAVGDHEGAAQGYRAAIQAACADTQRFLLYGPLAEAECRAGRIEVGRSLLVDYSCMLAVAVGEQECGAAPPERAVTELCAATMCGEQSFRLKEQPFPEGQLEALKQSAEAARRACVEPG